MQFRKQKKVGPLRFTITNKGISGSAGVPGARMTLNSRGRVTRTASIPGSGLSHSTSSKLGGTTRASREQRREALADRPVMRWAWRLTAIILTVLLALFITIGLIAIF